MPGLSKTFTRNKICYATATLIVVVGLRAATGPDASAIIRELNVLRANPAAYAGKLQQRRKLYRGRIFQPPGRVGVITNEGVTALDEAIRVLRATKALPLVAASEALTKAATQHVKDIGPKGLTAHEGSDGSTPQSRILRYAKGMHSTAEVISFGPADAASAIVELVVDDGIRNRGHRKILLDPGYRNAGAACGPHKTFRVVCVIDFADTVR